MNRRYEYFLRVNSKPMKTLNEACPTEAEFDQTHYQVFISSHLLLLDVIQRSLPNL